MKNKNDWNNSSGIQSHLSKSIPKQIKHTPANCPMRGKGDGTFGCTDCMPIEEPKQNNNWIERYNNKFYYDDGLECLCFNLPIGSPTKIVKNEDIKSFIQSEIDKAIEEERNKIKKDLIKIADSGEYEDLRREVEDYFIN